jgi:hypothetical protein
VSSILTLCGRHRLKEMICVFWPIRPSSPLDLAHVSETRAVSVFRRKRRGSLFLRNAGKYLSKYTASPAIVTCLNTLAVFGHNGEKGPNIGELLFGCIESKAVTLKNVILWDLTSCGSRKKTRRFGGIYRLPLQVNKTIPSLSSSKRNAPHKERGRWPLATAPPQSCLSVTVELLLMGLAVASSNVSRSAAA